MPECCEDQGSASAAPSTPVGHDHAAAAAELLAGVPADSSPRTLFRSKIGEAVELSFAGAVLDVGVSDLGRAEAFYSVLLGRGPDLQPQPDQREWFMHRAPEVDFRITAQPADRGIRVAVARRG